MHNMSIQHEICARGNCTAFSTVYQSSGQRRAVRTTPDDFVSRASTVFTRSAAASAVAHEDWKP